MYFKKKKYIIKYSYHRLSFCICQIFLKKILNNAQKTYTYVCESYVFVTPNNKETQCLLVTFVDS